MVQEKVGIMVQEKVGIMVQEKVWELPTEPQQFAAFCQRLEDHDPGSCGMDQLTNVLLQHNTRVHSLVVDVPQHSLTWNRSMVQHLCTSMTLQSISLSRYDYWIPEETVQAMTNNPILVIVDMGYCYTDAQSLAMLIRSPLCVLRISLCHYIIGYPEACRCPCSALTFIFLKVPMRTSGVL
jgi:hypothetical protein